MLRLAVTVTSVFHNTIEYHKGYGNIWYFDTDAYQIEGVARFYICLANNIKILNAPELEDFVASFSKEFL